MTELLVATTFFIIKTCTWKIPDHSGERNENRIVEQTPWPMYDKNVSKTVEVFFITN